MVNRNLLRQFDTDQTDLEIQQAFGDLGSDLDRWLPDEGQVYESNKIVNGRVARALVERGLHNRLLDEAKDKPGSPRIAAGRKKLIAVLGARDDKGRLAFAEKAKAFEPGYLSEFNALLIAEWALPGVAQPSFTPNFVDQRLAAPRRWFDSYNADDSWWRWHGSARSRRCTPFASSRRPAA